MMTVPVRYVPTLEDALSVLASQKPCVLSLVPASELKAKALCVQAGAFDFDGTLIAGSQWMALDSILPEIHRLEIDRTRDWYTSLHNKIANPDMVIDHPDWFHDDIHPDNMGIAEAAWVSNTIRIYQNAGVTRDQIDQIARTLTPRIGTLQLLAMMKQRVVISMGMEQVIESWLIQHGIPSPVAASRLHFTNNIVSGYNFNVVVGHTKRLAVERFCLMTGMQENQMLVVGDSHVDASMMKPDGFNVFILPITEADDRFTRFRQHHLPAMWNKLTMIICGDSLLPLVQLLQSARL